MEESLEHLRRLGHRLQRVLEICIERSEQRLDLASRLLRTASSCRGLQGQRLASLRDALVRAQRTLLDEAARDAQATAAALELVNPRSILERGYAIVRDRDARVVRSPGQVAAGHPLALELAEGETRVRVEAGAPGAGA